MSTTPTPGTVTQAGLARSLPKERVGDSSRRSRADRVDAPVRLDTVDVAGLLAIQAIGLWARTPLDVVPTFGISPTERAHRPRAS